MIKLSESDWEGLPPPPILCAVKPENTISKSQDPAATPVATSLGLPGVGCLPQIPTLSTPPALGHSLDESTSSAPTSPSTSISALSDFTIADSLDGNPVIEPAVESVPGPAVEPAAQPAVQPVAEPGTITPHDMFYLEDGSVEVICGMTLFRVHASIFSFQSPVLRQMFSPANLAAAESPNGRPRILSSDTPTDFAILLKAIYIPG